MTIPSQAFVSDSEREFPYELVSAGEVVTISSSAGTYVELQRETDLDSSYYSPSFEQLPLPFPANLVIDIPGDEFPAFASIAVPANVEPLVARDIDGANATFSWVAGNNSDAKIVIELTSDPIGILSSDTVTETVVRCRVADDGKFSLPESIISQLPENFSLGFVDMQRQVLNVVQVGNVVLLVGNSSVQ